VLVAAPPPFVAHVTRVTRAELPYSWRPGCPVGPAHLRRIRLSYWGFDGKRHLGELVVNARVVGEVKIVFRRLYQARFPIRRMRPIDVYEGKDRASMAADNTSAFNCRLVAVPGATNWSMHAYGEAIDVNTVENPFVYRSTVSPPAGRAYLDRSHVRPGMAVEGSALVRAFDAVGWGWGGRWTTSRDYQHFSTTGR
jgi:hypothetical protein